MVRQRRLQSSLPDTYTTRQKHSALHANPATGGPTGPATTISGRGAIRTRSSAQAIVASTARPSPGAGRSSPAAIHRVKIGQSNNLLQQDLTRPGTCRAEPPGGRD